MTSRYKTMVGFAGLLLLAAVPLYYGVSGSLSSEDARSAASSVMRPVPTVVVAGCPAECQRRVTREFPGSVRANRRVELAFDLDGLLVELHAREGSRVTKGSMLARLDARNARNALSAAQAHFDDASRTLERTKTLRRQSLLSESEYDQALSTWEIAKADLRIREKALADTTIVAPFDGVVAARHVENHERVEAGQQVISLQDTSRVEVVIQVPEHLIAHGGIEALRDPKVRLDVYDGRWLKARAHEYRVQPDAATRTYDLIVALTPPEDIEVLPGMTATVKAQIDAADLLALDPSGPDWTRIPLEAIWTDGSGTSYVWVIPEQGGAPRQARVELGPLQNGQVLIRSRLSPGQHVAVAGLHALRAGIQVRPRAVEKEGLEG